MFSNAAIINTPGTPLPSYYNAMTDGLSSNRCHNDGVQDDSAHIVAQANAAHAAGKTLYLPAGTGYKLTTTLNTPAGTSSLNPLRFKGDGMGTRFLGQTRLNSYQRYDDIFFGVSTDQAIGFQNQSVTKDIKFTRCKFRGGQTGGVFHHTYDYKEVYNVEFYDSKFEVAYFDAFTPMAHSLDVQIDCKYDGGVHDGLLLDHCHVGVPNQYGQTENKYGGLLYYRHGLTNILGEEGTASNAYLNNLTLRNNIFEHSWNWCVDYTGNHDTDPTRTHPLWSQRCTIEDNLFKGCGGHRAEASEDFPVGLDLEPVYYAEVNRNVMYRCDWEAIKFTYDSKYCNCKDNIIDYRPNNGSIVYVSSTSDYNYWYRRVIRLLGGTGFTVTGNEYYLPTNWSTYSGISTPPPDNSQWIYNESTGSTITGNKVYVNDTIVDWESQMDVGCSW